MKPRINRFILPARSALVLALAAAPVAALAQSSTWNTTVTGASWNTNTNWVGNVIADGSGNTADFSQLDITADTTVNLTVNRTIGNLIFGDTATGTAGSWILAGGGGILTLAGTTPTITVNALGSNKFARFDAILAGTNGFTKTGAGNLLLNNAGNTISGAVVMSQGNIQLNTAGLTNATTVAINAGTLVVATTAANAIGGTISFGGGILQYNVSNPTTDYSAQFSTAASQQYKINVTGSNTVTLSSALTSAGGALTKGSTGTLTLSAANTFSGTTTIGGGNLVLSNALALQNSAIDTTNSIAGTASAGLVLSGVTTPTLGGLTGNKALASLFNTSIGGYGSVTNVTLNPGAGASWTYSGAITDGAAGMTLTKSGAGTQTLSGGAGNTLSGAINVNEGTLAITKGADNVSSAKNMPGAITVASGATLSFDQAFTTAPDNNLANALNLSGPGTSATVGALHLFGNATASGAITLDADATITKSYNSCFITGSITGLDKNLTLKTTQSSVQPGLTVSAPISLGTGGITVTGAGGTNIVTLSGANSYSGGTTVTAGTLKFANVSALGSGGLAITGDATLQAGGAYTLGNAMSVATGVTGTVDTNGNATTLTGAITGDGNLAKTGSGILTLTGGTANTFSGPIAINGGRLAVSDGTSLKNVAGAITVASGASFEFGQQFTANNLTNALILSGTGDGTLGALNLSENAVASGTITLAADTTISHDYNNATISGTITGTDRNLTLKTTQSAQPGLLVSAPITLGAGGVTVNGAGGTNTVTLSGDNSYSGGTLVTAGTLLVSNTTGSGTGSGAVTVNSGATLGGTGRIAGAVNVSGVLSPGASIESLGTSTLTLNNGSDFIYEMNTASVTGDLSYVAGDLNIGSNVTLNLTDLATLSQVLAVGTKFTLLSYTGVWNSGTFTGYAEDSIFLFANNEWRINYNDLTGGSNFTSDQAGATGFVTLAVVPEPSSVGLVGLGGLGALLLRRRRGN